MGEAVNRGRLDIICEVMQGVNDSAILEICTENYMKILCIFEILSWEFVEIGKKDWFKKSRFDIKMKSYKSIIEQDGKASLARIRSHNGEIVMYNIGIAAFPYDDEKNKIYINDLNCIKGDYLELIY